MTNKKIPKNPQIFTCVFCDYLTYNKKDFEKHCLTIKHQNRENPNKSYQKIPKNPQTIFYCICGKSYKHRSSLSSHKKKCELVKNENLEEEINYHDTIKEILNENKELRKTINDIIPKIGNNNNNIINNKNKFNINVFLNEKCKDALTIDQFVKSIEISLHDLLLTKEKGVNEGVSNILLENMNRLSLYERPIHCIDKKRETMYVNSDEGWHKDENNKEIRDTINKVTHLQHKNISKWVENNPNWQNNSKLENEYLELVKNCTNDINDDKVIKIISDPLNIENTDKKDNLIT